MPGFPFRFPFYVLATPLLCGVGSPAGWRGRGSPTGTCGPSPFKKTKGSVVNVDPFDLLKLWRHLAGAPARDENPANPADDLQLSLRIDVYHNYLPMYRRSRVTYIVNGKTLYYYMKNWWRVSRELFGVDKSNYHTTVTISMLYFYPWFDNLVSYRGKIYYSKYELTIGIQITLS